MRGTLFLLMGAALSTACGVEGEDAAPAAVAQSAVQLADLRLTLSGPATVVAGSTGAYQVVLRNIGTKSASSPIVNVQLPSGMTLASASSGCAANGPSTVRCTYGSALAAGVGTSRTLNLISPSVGGTVQLAAQATTSSQEITLTNNQASLSVSVYAPPPPVPITLAPPQAMLAQACFGVSSFAECVPAAVVEEYIVLNPDYTITTSTPEYGGTWSQPNGPTSLRLSFVEQLSGNTTIVYDGTGISSTCVEGTGAGPGVPGAGFRACTY